ncbi:MAG: hypothetical protein KF862_27335 [Chitinophagaceae bacterium]|nr:hypothetical protein [Chitinophagaceae bacterium]
MMQELKLSPLKIIPVLLAVIVTFSCSKDNKEDKDDDYTCTSCASAPIAVAANNTLTKGIYKGVLIGSTGTLIFDIQNTTNTITGTMVIDGKVADLTCEAVEIDLSADFEASLTGTLNGYLVIIRFHIDKGGINPRIIEADIPGHPDAVFLVAKETSDALLECYEGAYTITGDWTEEGTYNFLVTRKGGGGTWSGIVAEDGFPGEAQTDTDYMSGNNLVDANRLGQGRDVVIGTVNGHTISGSFVDVYDDDDEKVTIAHKGKRTL